MKAYMVIFIAALSSALCAQNYKVENISGNVRVLKGTSESYVKAVKGEALTPSDMIETGEKSSVSLKTEAGAFSLKENSALSLNYLKNISKNDLILMLASEEIKAAPGKNKTQKSGSTAVYGADESSKTNINLSKSEMGLKRLNGAMQLAESGFKESSILAAKDTYKKYPSTKDKASYRIFFADKLAELGLYDEAYLEFTEISALKLTAQEKETVSLRLGAIKKKMIAD
jgi:hypothetical protein